MPTIQRPKAIKPKHDLSYYSEDFQPFNEVVNYERVFNPSYLHTIPELVEIIKQRREKEIRQFEEEQEQRLKEYIERLNQFVN